MVSFPDWTKFGQINDNKQNQDSQALLKRFYKQQEEEAVRQAEESGYFLLPTEDFLKSRCGHQNKNCQKLEEFRLIRVGGLHVRILEDIALCSNLSICLLGNNFITKLEPLISCRHLIKLDVHSNQLSSVPSMAFWTNLRRLQFLHLHDNPLGQFETLQMLSLAPSLLVLTLYDTPLSLKKNYRHHVVNSIWTLKALDHHVISDEEIIEDAVFQGRFTALSSPLKTNLSTSSSSEMTYEEEVESLHKVMATINRIMALNSPVLIVQKWLRGYLVRKRMRGISHRCMTSPRVLEEHLAALSRDTITYDSYIKYNNSVAFLPADKPQMSDSTSLENNIGQRIHVDLGKLQTGTLRSLQAENVAMETAMVEKEGKINTEAKKTRKKDKTKVEENKAELFRARKVKDQKQFFGAMVESFSGEKEELGDEIPLTRFRLQGQKPKLLISDATTEMILSKKESGEMVREAEALRLKLEACKPQPTVEPHNFTVKEQRMFNRVHGTMGLSCLLAVHKAYKEREKAEKTAAKIENILGMREERQRAKDRISLYHEERRAQVLKSRDLERARIIDRLEKRELQRLNFLDKQQEGKVKNSDVTKHVKADYSFMQDFSTQHTSVSNALLRHDRQARREDRSSVNRNKVKSAKTNEQEKQEVVKKFLDHRRELRQTETAMGRAALDTKMLSEANDRINEARSRVAHQKARTASVNAFYPLPPSWLPASAGESKSRFEASVMSASGRVGRHHTVLT